MTTWHELSDDGAASLRALRKQVEAMPKTESTENAAAFFAVADERVQAWQSSCIDCDKAKLVAHQTLVCYEAYCEAADEVLLKLYDTVQKDFADSYRFINSDDESKFTAALRPSSGKLQFDVDFYERGHHPPAALHSEGHQDGMGLCLYLALMKHLFGREPQLMLLDDVVMSVDSQHRRQLCDLLQKEFPKTQFVITTHDKAWFHQMLKTGLVNKKTGVRFVRWSLESGPSVLSTTDVWAEIEIALRNDDVSGAAHKLRRFLEYVMSDYAEMLDAKTPHRADNDHSYAELFNPTLKKFRDLLKQAERSAKRWGKAEIEDQVVQLQNRINDADETLKSDDWMINKSVHYTPWDDFSTAEFRPIVDACRDLVAAFGCSKCGSPLVPVPTRNPQSIRCRCDETRFNLTEPPKADDASATATQSSVW